jgi:hypothetical protein
VSDPNANPTPSGVRAIAGLFAVCGGYLAVLALLILVRPGMISMTAGAFLLFGLELAGPYMFLLIAIAAGGIAWGLLRLNNIMRHAAILAACAGIVMLVPPVSGAAVGARLKGLVIGGLGIIIRVMVAWYLSQGHIAELFRAPRSSSR